MDMKMARFICSVVLSSTGSPKHKSICFLPATELPASSPTVITPESEPMYI